MDGLAKIAALRGGFGGPSGRMASPGPSGMDFVFGRTASEPGKRQGPPFDPNRLGLPDPPYQEPRPRIWDKSDFGLPDEPLQRGPDNRDGPRREEDYSWAGKDFTAGIQLGFGKEVEYEIGALEGDALNPPGWHGQPFTASMAALMAMQMPTQAETIGKLYEAYREDQERMIGQMYLSAYVENAKDAPPELALMVMATNPDLTEPMKMVMESLDGRKKQTYLETASQLNEILGKGDVETAKNFITSRAMSATDPVERDSWLMAARNLAGPGGPNGLLAMTEFLLAQELGVEAWVQGKGGNGINGEILKDLILPLRDRYIKESEVGREYFNGYQTLLNLQKQSTGEADHFMMFMIAKILDPGSVFREGEYDRQKDTLSVPEAWERLFGEKITGERMTKDQRARFMDAIRERLWPVFQAYQNTTATFLKMGKTQAAGGFVPNDYIGIDPGVEKWLRATHGKEPEAMWSYFDELPGAGGAPPLGGATRGDNPLAEIEIGDLEARLAQLEAEGA